MIADSQKNEVYVSQLLFKQHKVFAKKLKAILNESAIQLHTVEGAKDIWCRDFMPVQIANNRAIQFVFNPSYLKAKKYDGIRTNTSDLVLPKHLLVTNSFLTIDGGNIINNGKIAILTDRILKENNYSKDTILEELSKMLQVEQIIIAPAMPNDFTGHIDGMIRFVSENEILLNDYSNLVSKQYWNRLLTVLLDCNLKITLLPNALSYNQQHSDATGDYINFLQVRDLIIVPQYGYKLDKVVIELFKDKFPIYRIVGLKCNEIAKQGGVLNCITWTIKTKNGEAFTSP